MSITTIVNYPKDVTVLQDIAAEGLADILLKKLLPKEVDELVHLLEEERSNISM